MTPSIFDLTVLLLLLWWAYRGYQRGFILTAFDTAFRAATLAAIAVWSASVATFVVARWRLASEVALIGAIAVFVVSFEIVRSAGASGLRSGSDVLLRESPGWRYLNRLAGLATGVARGAITVTLLLVLVLALPLGPTIPSLVRDSTAGRVIAILWPTAFAASSTTRSPSDAMATVLDSRGLAMRGLGTPTTLPFTARTAMALDTQGETDFLAMSNLARAQSGATPLASDPTLATVARQHSLDMVAEVYFAHETPGGATPADRLRAADVPFQLVAENIVFAPTLAVAFQSIMDSPEHRQNQLSPEYHRVGIGIVQTASGLLVTEDFAD
jgi:uncharacterized protein YkwD